jgi:hypothetical protein
MNKLSNIPNRIKQPSICCTYCGKGYKSRNAFEKHLILCEILSKSKSKSKNKTKNTIQLDIEEDDDIPSNRRMYLMLLELGNKYNKLEQKMEEMNKWIVKKKKKMNMLEWLHTSIEPTYTFDALPSKIIVTDTIIEFLLNNSFNDTLNELFSTNLYLQQHNTTEEREEREKEEEKEKEKEKETTDKVVVPLFASGQKANTFYIYDKLNTDEAQWEELSKDKFIKFLNIIQMKISKAFSDWKKTNKSKLSADESLNTLCDKALVKIMAPNFKQETTSIKVKHMMYNKMKTDVKTVVEYEFE